MSRRGLRGVSIGLLAATAVLVAGWWLRSDPAAELRAHAPETLACVARAAPDLGPGIVRWRIATTDGETLAALWRPAPAALSQGGIDAQDSGAPAPWTIVLLGGLETGDRAALLLPDLPVNVLAMDWPWHGPRTMSPAELVRSIPAIRAAVLRSPGTLAAGVRLAADQPTVDGRRIALVGASLGAPPTIAALRLTDQPSACVLLHGAADVRGMLRHALDPFLPRGIDALVATLAARAIRPLEPRLHAPHLQHVPMLFVNATEDDKLSPSTVEALHRAFPRATVWWQSGRHLRPQNETLVDSLAVLVLDWLEALELRSAEGTTDEHGFPGLRSVPQPASDAATMLASRGETAPRASGEESHMAECEVATLAGGCFWCLEAVFLELRGVESVVSGYAGGHVPNPSYEQVCSGRTGHAEVVQVTFDPSVIAYRELLEVFFTIHDPTTLNRQGADVGTQYRSAIFFHSPGQRATAEAVITSFDAEALWGAPIVTEVAPLETFYPAEAYHQDYFRRNPAQPYCQVVVAPKVAKVRSKFLEKLRR